MNGKLVRVLEAGGLPQDALCDCARVTMTGQSRVTIEGQHGIVELGTEQIRLRTGDGVLRVCGQGLTLKALSPQQAVITGQPVDMVSYRIGEGKAGRVNAGDV